MQANIPSELESLTVPIDSVKRHPGNPRRGDLPSIESSLMELGQLAPIVVQEATRHIVAGNHVYQSAVALGWDSIAAVVSPLSDAEAAAFLLADNRLSDLAIYDTPTLVAVLTDLDRQDALAGTGFTRAELNAMMGDEPDDDDDADGGYEPSETDEPMLRTFSILLPAEQAEEVLRWCTKLSAKYGVTGAGPTIIRAIEAQAK